MRGGEDMEIKVTGTPDEIEKLLNAIGGSKEQSVETVDVTTGKTKRLNP